MSNRKQISVLSCCAALGMAAGAASAQVTTYDSLAAWLADAGGVPDCIDGLGAFGADVPIFVPPLFLPACAQWISTTYLPAGSTHIDVFPFDSADNNGTTHVRCYVNFAEPAAVPAIPGTDVRIQIQGVCAWGAQFWGADTGEGLTLEFLSPASVVLASISASGVAGEFMGFVSPPGAVSVVRLKSSSLTVGPGGELFGMDNLRIKYVNCHYTSHCYPNCDNSTSPPTVNVLDFACFLNRFAAADPWANCDNSTVPPTLNVLDFACFLNRFAAGCS